MKLDFITKLPIPKEIKERYPLDEQSAELKKKRDKEIEAILSGEDDRIILVIGPCSADREDSVLAYIEKLVPLQEKVKEKIFIIPRVYTNKPRTKGTGYKGMAESPDPTQKPDLIKGTIAIRKLHMKALLQYGFSCADEMLYPENHRYLDDLLAYVAVGARSVENQQHRLVASGVGIPVGMKNPTSGDLSVMMNAIFAAQQGHVFEYRGWECHSEGNPFTHAVLRGYVNHFGLSMPNYHYENLRQLYDAYQKLNLKNPGVIVDANHSNSNKSFLEQPRIVREVLHSARHSREIWNLVKGFMIESYLVDGRQDIGGGCFGQSITDPCLGWEKTEQLVYEIADAL